MKVYSDQTVTACLFNQELLDQMLFCCNIITRYQGLRQSLYSSSGAGYNLAEKISTHWEIAIKEKEDLA